MIGAELHHFATTTWNAFPMKELWQETHAHQCHALKKNVPTVDIEQHSGCLPKTFNINTIKNHPLGDYPNQIHHFGMTNLYSTELVGAPFSFMVVVYTQISVSLSD